MATTVSIRRALIVAGVCGLGAVVGTGGQSIGSAQAPTPQTTLGLAGHTNSTPSLAVLDRGKGRRCQCVRRHEQRRRRDVLPAPAGQRSGRRRQRQQRAATARGDVRIGQCPGPDRSLVQEK